MRAQEEAAEPITTLRTVTNCDMSRLEMIKADPFSLRCATNDTDDISTLCEMMVDSMATILHSLVLINIPIR
jgi:hypothetical protein